MSSIRSALHAVDLGAESDLLARFEALRDDACPWLLDTAAAPGDPRRGCFSYAGSDPWWVLRAFGDRVELECRRAVHPALPVGRRVESGDPLEAVRALLPRLAPGPDAELPVPFAAGAVGWLGHELAARLEPVRFRPREGPATPDLCLVAVDRLLALDHATGRLKACGLGFGADPAAARRAARAAAESLARRVAHPPAPAGEPPPTRPHACFAHADAADHRKAVEAAQEEIAAGEIYQACLTQRIDVPCPGDPWPLYRRLRRVNPAPFGAYLALPEVTILSSSPERFLRLEPDGRVEARPIKGTRRVGADPVEALRSARELAACPKDRAENVMIVDLYRNDLGRVCETGSVRVPELLVVERHGRLLQLVSTVTGRLAPGRDAFDLLRAAFPPGSMTGAPKIAALRILDRLETTRRGIYAGALGWFDVRGGMDLSVVIRAALVADGVARVHAGGGIVADSEPEAEYREAMAKAEPLLRALGVGRGDPGRTAPVR